MQVTWRHDVIRGMLDRAADQIARRIGQAGHIVSEQRVYQASPRRYAGDFAYAIDFKVERPQDVVALVGTAVQDDVRAAIEEGFVHDVVPLLHEMGSELFEVRGEKHEAEGGK